MTESFPRQLARTRGFNLGLPRSFTVASDGSRVAFLRTAAGDDPAASLWVYDVAEDRERVVFDATGAGEEHITAAERDRRERAGEKQTGVVTYGADPALRVASFVVGERLLVADLTSGDVRELEPAGPAFDPRPDPSGRRVAYVTDDALHTIDLATGHDEELAADPGPDVRWGLAEFVAAEEMGRLRGYWWAPDGGRLIAARVDEREVLIWHLSSPIDPRLASRPVRYPQADSANAVVTLHVISTDGSRTEVTWDRGGFEYVAAVHWSERGAPLALVQSRDQREVRVLAIDPDSGATETVWADHDDRWTDLMPGAPTWLSDGRLVTAAHREDAHALLVDGEVVTPAGLQVTSVVDASETLVFTGSQEPGETHVWRLDPRGEGLVRITAGAGVRGAAAGGGLTVVVAETPHEPLPTAFLLRTDEPVHVFASVAETPSIAARPFFLSLGPRELRAAIFTPDDLEPAGPLPVLLDPYGGPGHARATKTSRGHLESRWFADQGFVVLVADGRGTPNRGVDWEQAVWHEYIDLALEDQVEALQAAAARFGYLDLSKVAIRGWSYGGALVCAAMLRRPDVFHAGISGAPVTDMRLYDTHYMERYLGTPHEEPEAYDRADLVKDAAALRGELLILHGIADDNVYVAHSLRLSKALMEAGRRHSMIPLSGITHRPTDEAAAENMLKIEVEFLRRALGLPSPDRSG